MSAAAAFLSGAAHTCRLNSSRERDIEYASPIPPRSNPHPGVVPTEDRYRAEPRPAPTRGPAAPRGGDADLGPTPGPAPLNDPEPPSTPEPTRTGIRTDASNGACPRVGTSNRTDPHPHPCARAHPEPPRTSIRPNTPHPHPTRTAPDQHPHPLHPARVRTAPGPHPPRTGVRTRTRTRPLAQPEPPRPGPASAPTPARTHARTHARAHERTHPHTHTRRPNRPAPPPHVPRTRTRPDPADRCPGGRCPGWRSGQPGSACAGVHDRTRGSGWRLPGKCVQREFAVAGWGLISRIGHTPSEHGRMVTTGDHPWALRMKIGGRPTG